MIAEGAERTNRGGEDADKGRPGLTCAGSLLRARRKRGTPLPPGPDDGTPLAPAASAGYLSLTRLDCRRRGGCPLLVPTVPVNSWEYPHVRFQAVQAGAPISRADRKPCVEPVSGFKRPLVSHGIVVPLPVRAKGLQERFGRPDAHFSAWQRNYMPLL